MMELKTLTALYEVVEDLNSEIEDQMMETGQAFSLHISANESYASVLLAGGQVWSSEEHEGRDIEAIDKEIREEIRNFVETISKIKV